MSRYEQVCDLIRQRRAMRNAAQRGAVEGVTLIDGRRVFVEQELLAVIQDALIELGPLWRYDAAMCDILAKGRWTPREKCDECLLFHQLEDDWPLQSRQDA